MKNNDTGSMIYHFPVESGYILDGYNAQFSGIAQEISETLDSLTQRERDVIKMRFGFCGGSRMSLEEVGWCMSRTRDRIRQIEAKALQKLRHPSRSKRLEVYVECVGKPLPNWIWTTGMHVYEHFYEAENTSLDRAIAQTPLPWNEKIENLCDFEESLKKENTTSILKRIGYDVRQPEEERHAIIQYAISICGISKVYKCLKAMSAKKVNDFTSTYRKDWIYVVRNRENLAALSSFPEDLSAITIEYDKTNNIEYQKGHDKNANAEAYTEQDFDAFHGLKPESFLMQLGYNTFVPQEERFGILSYAARMYGQEKIIRLLRFFITIHKGDKKMQRACQIWQEDLEKCLEQYID